MEVPANEETDGVLVVICLLTNEAYTPPASRSSAWLPDCNGGCACVCLCICVDVSVCVCGCAHHPASLSKQVALKRCRLIRLITQNLLHPQHITTDSPLALFHPRPR